MSNIKSVAELAGVSPSTVSNVLNNTKPVSELTQKKVLSAVEKLNYKPDIFARNLRGKKTNSIGIAVPSISNPYYSVITRGIEEFFSSKNFSVILCNTSFQLQKESQAIRIFSEKKVDGAIFVSVTQNIDEIKNIIDKGMKVIALDQYLDLPNVDNIVLDNIKGGYLATNHLIEIGHNRIAFISGSLNRLSRKDRYQGYIKALNSKKIKIDKEIIKISIEEEIPKENPEDIYEFNNGYNQMLALLEMDSYPTAVFAINDITAVGCLKAIYEKSLVVGKDISLIGYDNISLAKFSIPGLTTIAQPKYKMGYLAAEMLYERIKGKYSAKKRIEVIEPNIVYRNTTGHLK